MVNNKWVGIIGYSMPYWYSFVNYIYHSEVLLLQHVYELNSLNKFVHILGTALLSKTMPRLSDRV